MRFRLSSLSKGSILSDSLWQIGGSIANRSSYFATLVILSGILSSKEYGIFGLLYSLVNSIASVNSSGLGIPNRRILVRTSQIEESQILRFSLVIIGFLSILLPLFVALYYRATNQQSPFNLIYWLHIIHLAFNFSVTLYLSCHYGGLREFVSYNRLLLPINILLPLIILMFPLKSIDWACVIISSITLLGNIVQILHLKKRGEIVSRSSVRESEYGFLGFVQKNYLSWLPCFLQSLLGLPVFFILQLNITNKWGNLALIGVITLSTQLLNISNIFAAKMLSVFSPRISIQYQKQGRISLSYFFKLLTFYMGIIILISLVLILLLPIFFQITGGNFFSNIYEIRYFILLNILSCLLWFFQEYLHSINMSSFSLFVNLIFSISLLSLFFVSYYHRYSFSLIDYANCIGGARIISILFCLVILYFYGKICKVSI